LETIYDWLTVALFAGLVVLFLQRSTGEDEPRDSIWQYLGAAVGCALSNYLGNHGYPIPAVLVFAATIAYVYYVLKPFDRGAA